jgi:hypothetical protein
LNYNKAGKRGESCPGKKINIIVPISSPIYRRGEVGGTAGHRSLRTYGKRRGPVRAASTVENRFRRRRNIRVTDDGLRMAPEDAVIAFLAHATSKTS